MSDDENRGPLQLLDITSLMGQGATSNDRKPPKPTIGAIILGAILGLFELLKTAIGISVGIICIAGGAWLSYVGITANTSWSIHFMGESFDLTTSAPGVVMIVAGMAIVFVALKAHEIRA